MKPNFARGSLILLVLSILFLVLLTLFESALVGLSLMAERGISLLMFVLVPAIGAVLGAISLVRKEGRTGMAVTGLVLNTLFALFHTAVLLFAG